LISDTLRYATLRSTKPDMSDNPPPSIPTGRARGRARARAFTQEELDAVRMPGQAPKMKLVGRNYYDPEAKVDLKAFKLELWPGYETSIRQHENEVLLCCEVSHKILRTDTVLEQMQDVYKRDRANFRSGCEKILLGCIVMTRYNNRTYRIDDIAWDKHPTESFESSKGTPMTYIQYYEGKYNRTIRDATLVNCSKWAVVFAQKDAEVTQQFVNSMLKVCPSLGMVIGKPKTFELTDNRPATYIQTLDRVIDMKPAIVMVVIPNNKGDHYAVVKKKCCIDKPIPSQVMTATVLNKSKGLMNGATNVALQMICKLGLEPWAVKIPLKNTMVIGYDTYHDSLYKDKSVGAVVASVNSTFTKFISMADFHSNQSEMTDRMCPSIGKALRRYNSLNGCLPERVIMYR
jgi:hypothetical protein